MSSLPGDSKVPKVTGKVELADKVLEGGEVLSGRVLIGNRASKVAAGTAVLFPAFIIAGEGGDAIEPLEVLDEVRQRQGAGTFTVPVTRIIRAEGVQKLLVTGPVVRWG